MKRLFKSRKEPYCAAVVAAAGSSERMGGTDKLFTELCGVPVLARTLLAFEKCAAVDEIILAVRSEVLTQAAELVRKFGIDKARHVVAGGKTRLDSVANGVASVTGKADIILVHDGARPLVTCEIIEKTIAAAKEGIAAACAVPVKDTIKTAENGVVTSTPDRTSLFCVQTPQAFDADVFRSALHNAEVKGLIATDDCMIMEAIGVPVRLVEGSYENIKITTLSDLVAAEAFCLAREDGGEDCCECV